MSADDQTGLDRIHHATAHHEAAHVLVCVLLGLEDVEYVELLDFDSPEAEERGLNGYVGRRRMKPEVTAWRVAAVRGAADEAPELASRLEAAAYSEVLYDLAGIAADCRTGRLDPDDPDFVLYVEDGLLDEGSDVANAAPVLVELGVPLVQALADARELLDSPAAWAAVEAVATRLLPPPVRLEYEDVLAIPEVDRVFGSVGGDRVAEMLGRHRGRGAL